MIENLDNLQHKQLLGYAKDLAEIYEKEKEKRKKLELSNKKLEATINGITNGIVTIDEKLNIIENNEAFLKIIGNSLTTIKGKPLQAYLLKNFWEELYNGIEELKEPDEIILNPDDKRLRFYKIIRSPFLDSKGKLKGFILSFYDETLKKRNDMLKEEFLALVSHEIRTPLTIIAGFAPFLKESFSRYMSDEDQEYFDMIQESSDRLIRTVTELLDAAQFSVGFIDNPKIIDLHDVLDEALNTVSLQMKDIEHHIDYKKCSFLPHVSGYKDLLLKAISHLLENAIEFSPVDSTVLINTSLSGGMCQIIIQDQGQGIPIEELDRVFDKFYQIEESLIRKHEGLGLGLSIVKKVALLHHGKIFLESEPGKGTKAVFSLPMFDEKKDFEKNINMDDFKEQISYFKQQTRKYAEELAETYVRTKELSSKLHRSEQHIIRAEKLATMGQIAAGIAHEVNNMLAPIIGQAQLLLLKKDQLDPKILHKIQIINDSGFKAANMLSQILDFSRKTSGVFERIDIINLINKTLKLFDYRFRKSNIELVRQFDQERIEVLGNSGQLEQVFTNFIGNAIDAMQGGGRLTIKVILKEQIQEEQTDSWVEIYFTDTGIGVDEKTQESIFEPFFTTKEEGKGTGLGLFITYQIIENHGGVIDVESEINKSTTFIIKLKSIK